MYSPLTSGTNHSSFCSSVPTISIVWIFPSSGASIRRAGGPSRLRPACSNIGRTSLKSRLRPPYSSGICGANRQRSLASARSSVINSSVMSPPPKKSSRSLGITTSFMKALVRLTSFSAVSELSYSNSMLTAYNRSEYILGHRLILSVTSLRSSDSLFVRPRPHEVPLHDHRFTYL